MRAVDGELLVPGDPLPHRHELPEIPTEPVHRFVGTWITKHEKLENAVARCTSCHRLFVSREDPDGWGRVVRWVPLRWWHRRARRALAAGEGRPVHPSR